MRRRAVLLAALLPLLFFARPAAAAIAYVGTWCHENGATSANSVSVNLNNSTSGNGGATCSGSTSSQATPSAATAGDALVVRIGFTGSATGTVSGCGSSPCMTDSGSETYTSVDDEGLDTNSAGANVGHNCTSGGPPYCWATYVLCAMSGTITSVTAKVSVTGSFNSIVVDEFSGVASSSCVDTHSINLQHDLNSSTANSIYSGTFSTANNGLVEYADTGSVDVTGTSTAWSLGTSPLTQVALFSLVNANVFFVEGAATAANTTYTNGGTSNVTANGTEDFITEAVVLIPSAAVPTGGGGLMLRGFGN